MAPLAQRRMDHTGPQSWKLFVLACILLYKQERSEGQDDSDNDTAPRNGFDEILDEICESEDSEGEAW